MEGFLSEFCPPVAEIRRVIGIIRGSETQIEAIDDFCRYVDKPTVSVLDNAPTPRSELFIARLEKWMKKELYIFFLPRYSAHLNKAETYWRRAKYEWLKPADYGSFSKFKQKIYHIFNQVGLEYKVAFKELHSST